MGHAQVLFEINPLPLIHRAVGGQGKDNTMEKDIIDLHKNWVATEIMDSSGIIEFCSDDFEFFPTPQEQIRGKLKFLNRLKKSNDGSNIENIEITNRQVIYLNQLGSLKADFKTTIRTYDGQERTISGQHMWQLILENESWKVTRLTWKIDEA